MITDNIGTFKFWCQTVLPLVYDDSLSYYELLCKVVEYLNNTIADVKKLDAAFVELKNFVDGYLNDLNVQNEINNKLDEMANDGTLSSMIAKIMQSTINVVYAGMPNDGSDGSTILQGICDAHPNSTMFFPDGRYAFKNIESNGCSFVFTSGAIIENALDGEYARAINFTGCNQITVKGGIWRIGENSRKMVRYGTINGERRTTTILRFERCTNVSVSDMKIEWCSSFYGIYFNRCSNINVNRCSFNHCLCDGISMNFNTHNVNIDACSFTDFLICENPEEVDKSWCRPTIAEGTKKTDICHNITVQNCSFDNCEWEGPDTHAAYDYRCVNNTIHNTPRFIQAYYDPGSAPERTDNIIIENNYCYNDDDYVYPDNPYAEQQYGFTNKFGIAVTSAGKISRTNTIIKNNTLINPPSGGTDEKNLPIRANNCGNVEITNNHIKYNTRPVNKYVDLFHLFGVNAIIRSNVVEGCECENSYVFFSASSVIMENNIFGCWNLPPKYLVRIGGSGSNSFKDFNNAGRFSETRINQTTSIYNREPQFFISSNNRPDRWATAPGISGTNSGPYNGTVLEVNGRVIASNNLIAPGTIISVLMGNITTTCIVTDIVSHSGTYWLYVDAVLPIEGACTFTIATGNRTRVFMDYVENAGTFTTMLECYNGTSEYRGAVMVNLAGTNYFALRVPNEMYIFTTNRVIRYRSGTAKEILYTDYTGQIPIS